MQAGQGGGMVCFHGRVNPCSTGKEAAVPEKPVSSAWTLRHSCGTSHSTSRLKLWCPLTSPYKALRRRGNQREGGSEKFLTGLRTILRILMSGTQKSTDPCKNKTSSCWNQSISRCSLSTKWSRWNHLSHCLSLPKVPYLDRETRLPQKKLRTSHYGQIDYR